jgi:hypothetical protein
MMDRTGHEGENDENDMRDVKELGSVALKGRVQTVPRIGVCGLVGDSSP